jgi:hypothetical protein
MCKRLKAGPYFLTEKITLEWVRKLSVRPETLKPLWEKTGKTLEAVGRCQQR